MWPRFTLAPPEDPTPHARRMLRNAMSLRTTCVDGKIQRLFTDYTNEDGELCTGVEAVPWHEVDAEFESADYKWRQQQLRQVEAERRQFLQQLVKLLRCTQLAVQSLTLRSAVLALKINLERERKP